MVSRYGWMVAALAAGLCFVACTDKSADVATSAPPPASPAAQPPASTSATAAAPAPSAGPAVPAAGSPAPDARSASGANAPTAAGGAASPGGAAGPGAGDAVAETTAKLAAAQWAVRQDEIKQDPDGQWATAATASSTYNDAKDKDRFSAQQATGAPNVEKYSDDGRAWAPKTPDGGIEWLDLTFANPVHASEVRVRESMGSGAVIKVEMYDETGVAHVAWTGIDPTAELNYLILKFKPTEYKTKRVKVTLATNIIPGWNEIDAVQLVGKP
jgi:hypothetical protein